jgi:hypothetical protein
LSSIIQPLRSIQFEQFELPEDVSTTTSSTYSCDPEGPFENSLMISVCPMVWKQSDNIDEINRFLTVSNFKKISFNRVTQI